jgi:carbonic anhydrase
MDDQVSESAAPVARPSRAGWLKANFIAVALGTQMVVLLGSLIALGLGSSSPSPPDSAAHPEAEPLAPLPDPPAAAAPPGEPGPDAPVLAAMPLPPLPPPPLVPAEVAHQPSEHAPDASVASTSTPQLEQVVADLIDGNERFTQGVTRLRDPQALRRAPGKPKAVVLACSDATVPPELVFDQSLGALVVVRTAAELVDEGSLAAVEDAVARLEVPLVVVLGHQGCHAVEVAAKGQPAGPGLATVAARLQPVVAGLRKAGLSGQALTTRAVEATASFAAGQLARRSKLLSAGKPPVMRAVYDEVTGAVRWLDAGEETGAVEPGAGTTARHAAR